MDASAALTHVVVANLALAGENAQDAQGLQAPAAAARTVFAAAAFGALPLHVLQLHLQLPDGIRGRKDSTAGRWENKQETCSYCVFNR